jgi:hypothetical protein
MEAAAVALGTLRQFNLLGIDNQPSLPPAAGDIIPEEYPNYLYVFEGKEILGMLPHRHYDCWILLLEGKVSHFEPLQVLHEGRL